MVVAVVTAIIVSILIITGVLSEEKKEPSKPKPRSKDLMSHFYKENALASSETSPSPNTVKTKMVSTRIYSYDEVEGHERATLEHTEIQPETKTILKKQVTYGLKLKSGRVIFQGDDVKLIECQYPDCGELFDAPDSIKQCYICKKWHCMSHGETFNINRNGTDKSYFLCLVDVEKLREELSSETVQQLSSGVALVLDPKLLIQSEKYEQLTD